MKTSPQSSDGDEQAGTQAGKQSGKHSEKQADPHAEKHPRSMQEAAAPLPHETDQNPESQHEDEPRHVGKQAHRDVERGLKDTDRRGGDEYQQKTQNDAHTDVNSGVNSDGKPTGATGHRKH
jgi:hypothetical protein